MFHQARFDLRLCAMLGKARAHSCPKMHKTYFFVGHPIKSTLGFTIKK